MFYERNNRFAEQRTSAFDNEIDSHESTIQAISRFVDSLQVAFDGCVDEFFGPSYDHAAVLAH